MFYPELGIKIWNRWKEWIIFIRYVYHQHFKISNSDLREFREIDLFDFKSFLNLSVFYRRLFNSCHMFSTELTEIYMIAIQSWDYFGNYMMVRLVFKLDCKYGDKTLVGNFCFIEMRSFLLKYFFITKVLAPKSSVMWNILIIG